MKIRAVFLQYVSLRHSIKCPRLINAADIPTYRSSFLRKVCISLFLILFFSVNSFGQRVTISSPQEPGPTDQNPILIDIQFDGPVDTLHIADFNVINGVLENLNRETSNYEFQDSEVLDQFTINRQFGFSDIANIDQIISDELGGSIISIDYNSNNDLFYLTLRNGLFMLGKTVPVIDGNSFDTPLDLVIDKARDRFLIADSEQGKVFIYNSNYELITTIGTGSNADSENPRGATGLAVDLEGKIYVADNFTGNAMGQDAIKIYSPEGNFIESISSYNGQQIEDPFRIAVDKNYNIYLSESGGDDRNPRVVIFDKDYNSIASIEGGKQGTPGSLVVDNSGYLYVIDYEDDFNLTNLVDAPLEVLSNYETLRDSNYSINVFNTYNNFDFVKEIKNSQLNLPIDLAIDECENLAVNNLKLSGPGPSNYFLGFPTKIESTFKFTLETFERQDFYTAEILAEVEGEVSLLIQNKELFPCYPPPKGEFSIVYENDEDDTPPEATCNNLDVFLDENGEAQITAEQVYSGDEYLELEIDISSFNCSDVGPNQVELTVTDLENDLQDTCIATITVIDNTQPSANCVAPGKEFFLTNGTLTISASDIDDNSNDNCSIVNRVVSPSTFTSAGTKTITLTVTDASGLQDTCTTTIEVLDNTPPEATCNNLDVFLNENGEIQITAEQVYSGDEDLELEIDISSFNCSNLGENEVELTVTNRENGLQDTCIATITISDNIEPKITCRSDFSVPSEPGQNFAIVNFNTPSATDNCGIESVLQTQGLASGSQFNVGSHTITFEATDLNGLTSECSFEFAVLPPNLAPSIACPADISVNNDSGICGAIVEFPEPTVTDPESDDLIIIRTDDLDLNSGDIFPVGTTTLSYEVSDGINEPVFCSFTITVEDTEQPNFISCPDDISELLEASASGKIITFDLPQFEDNCSETELYQTEGPSSGEFFDAGETEVRFELRVNNTVVDQCSFSVNLVRQTATFQCIESILVNLGEDFQNSPVTEIPTSEFILSDSSNLDFELNVQQFTCEDIGTFDLPIRATDRETGENFSCTVEVTVRDVGAPLIICPADIQQRVIPAGGDFVLPQVTDRFTVTDNCAAFEDLEIVQNPQAGTIYSEAGDYIVMITATDPSGNTEECQVIYRLTLDEEPEEFALNCPQNESVIKADDNCEYIVPDFSNTIIYSPANATFSQSIPAGTRIEQSTSMEITASFEGESDSCTFELVLKDNTSPMLSCPDDRMIVVAEGESVEIQDYRGELEVSDNCGLAEIIQDPAPGTQISEDTEVSFIAYDTSNTNNASECSFMLTLAVDTEGNDIPIANEDFYSTPVNTILNISAEEGVLANDMDADGDELTATLVEDVTNGTLQLNPDGSFVYTPNDGFIGDDTFVYYVFDGFTEVETTVSISVVSVDTGGFQCVESYVLELDENGIAKLQITELYTGDASGVSFSLDKENFDCDDLGANQVILSYSGDENGSCDISIEVVDRIKPEIEVQNIGIDLDLSGNATITPRDVLVNFSDNCDDNISFELSRSTFSCKDLGWNEINVIATDASGNSSTTSLEVQVFAESGICDGTTEGSEYIFIYPNPNQGSFKVATPADVTISRIEVFDHRGRFITGKDFAPTVGEYAISTGPLQEAVYVVKMITNEGEKTKRFIIKN